MTTIVPRNEIVKRAVRWISEERVARPRENISTILDEAGLRFDLSPTEEAWLRQMLAH